MSATYDGPILPGMMFDWGDLGRCTIISNPKGIGEAVKYRAADGRTFHNGEAYWRRMAVNIALRSRSEQTKDIGNQK